jgi:poly(3-hydroxybutyrate) depolymerase
MHTSPFSARLPRSLVAPLAALLVGVAPALLHAQAQTGILSLSVTHSTLKNTAKPTGELKVQVDSLDVLIASAAKFGRTSELRRLYAHSIALLQKRAWTPEAEFASALLVRSDRLIVDPARPWTMRLEQSFSPSIALERPLTARVALRRRDAANPRAPLVLVKELGVFDGVPRDLRDAPFAISATLRDVPDGSYVVTVDMADSARALGTASVSVVVRNGLDASVQRLETAAAKAAEPLRSDLLFPIDRMRNVNASRIALGTFNAARDFAAAESLLTSASAKKDPWLGKTGDLKRHYRLDAADEIMPYRLYVPTAYSARKPMPLVIALHGLGATEDSFFESYGGTLPKLAEQRGYIIAAPLGYRVDGGYGVALSGGNDPAATRARTLSEQDVLEVLAAVRKQYAVDGTRTYLMGHSMGAIGTWAIAAKTPTQWSALGVFAGFGVASTAKTIGAIPQFVVHGDADPTVPVLGSRMMVSALKNVGAEVQYIEVPGGNHSNVVEPNFVAMFDFFDRFPKR